MKGKRPRFRTRRRRRRHSFDFTPLESRCLLAALPEGANLLVNPEFEPASVGDTQFYTNQEVPGWTAGNSDSGQRINLLQVQNGPGFVLELDSTSRDFDRVYQEVQTRVGAEYVLAFQLRERPVNSAADPVTNDVEVYWNDTRVGRFTATDHWQTIVIPLTAESELTRVEFREVAEPGNDGGDGRGPLIDNVRLTEVSDQLLENGSFEQVQELARDMHPNGGVPGWFAMGETGERVLQIRDGGGSEGERYLEVDSSAERLDRVFVDLPTLAGEIYAVAFDLRSASGEADASNELRVRWNDQWAGTFQGDAGWQSFGLLVEADSSSQRLVLREPPIGEFNAGDGAGPWIDNVRVFRVGAADLPPSIDVNGGEPGNDATASFTEGFGPTLVAPVGLTVSGETSASLNGASVQILNLLNPGSEELSVDTAGTGITADFDADQGLLTLTGDAAPALYQQVLRTLTYENVSDDPAVASRQLELVVRGKGGDSAPGMITVDITPVNDPPFVAPIGDPTINVGEPFFWSVAASDPENDPLSFEIRSSGAPIGGDSAEPAISADGQISWTAERTGDLQVTVEVRDAEGESSERSFTIRVRRNAEVPEDFVPFSGNRQLSGVLPSLRNGVYDQPPEFNIDTDQQYEAVFTTDEGEIRVRLFDDTAPNTVNNFVNLARDGFFDGLTFHRVVSLGPGLIAQGGDPRGDGRGGPGYRFNDEPAAMGDFNRRDLLAMANGGPNTNGSQFFFTLAPQPHLNGRHAIFGEVISGSDVVDAINVRDVGSATPAEIIHSVEIIEQPEP